MQKMLPYNLLDIGFELENKKNKTSYIIENLVGTGGFAIVFLVREKKTQKK